MNTAVTMPAAALAELAERALVAGGMRAADASRVARVLLLADLFGIHTHGVQRIPQYVERVRVDGLDARADVMVERLAAALARVNGANGVGPLVGMHALDAAMEGARAAGVGAAFVHGSNHFGPVMPYCFLAAEQGFATIIASNATTTIAPWGGREARLGNSPLGIGVPCPGGDPVILDVAMSMVARAKIRAAAKRGDTIPDTWATDADGRPTTDPRAALDGFLLPIGGHKGYGLALMVDMLAGLLSGASYLTRVSSWNDAPEQPQDLGHVFLLVDTRRLGEPTWLNKRVEDFVRILHDTPPADPAQPVRVPGELEMAFYHRQLHDGVVLDAEDVAALRALADTRT